jgi:hypothetical protein
VSPDSSASRRRQLAGWRPDCESSRTAPAPAANSANATPQDAFQRGRSWSRTQASVITPSVPSEPISIRSGLGPAPDPGRRRLSHSPDGVIARTDSTRSSMCVCSVAKWPPARVAIHPPSVENSNDCGKWRSVSPWGRSWSSSEGPNVPAWMRAAREVSSTSSTRSRAPRSIVTAPE